MRPTAPRRADFPYFRDHTTRWNDNDVYGHLNNIVHYVLIDTTVSTWLLDNGFSTGKAPATSMVVDSGCTYFSELSYPHVISAGLRVAHIGTSSARYEIGLFQGDSGIASASGHLVHVYLDPAARRPAPISEKMRAALAELQLAST